MLYKTLADSPDHSMSNEALSGFEVGNMEGIFDFFTSPAQSLKDQFYSQISDAQTKLQAKVGTFLTTGELIKQLKARAQQQQNSNKSEVQSRASAIVAKSNGLLTQFDSINSDAMSDLSNLGKLKTDLATSQVFNFADPLTAGTRIVELFNQQKTAISNGVTDSLALVGRMDQHIKDVNTLKSDVEGLESYAQGKGISALTDQFTSGVGSTLKPVLVVGTIGLLIYFLAPSFMVRSARAKMS